jgi:hypothetical protein
VLKIDCPSTTKGDETDMVTNKLAPTVLAVISLTGIIFAAPLKSTTQKPSPPGTAEITLKGKKITIAYSRPSMRGRKIVGGLVPFGQVWRTGANEATSFVTETDLTIGGATVPKGSYTLYSLPSEGGWKLIINKQTGQWGTEYTPGQDLARVDMKVEKLSSPVEQFTMSLKPAGAGAVLSLEWETTRASVNIAVK